MSDDIVAGNIPETLQRSILEIMYLAIRSANEGIGRVFVAFNPDDVTLLVSVKDDGGDVVFHTVIPLDCEHSDPTRELNKARAFINTYCKPRSEPVEMI